MLRALLHSARTWLTGQYRDAGAEAITYFQKQQAAERGE